MEAPNPPDGWKQIRFELSEPVEGELAEPFDAVWTTDDESVVVFAESMIEDGQREPVYSIIVEQRVEKDGYAAEIQSHSRVEQTPERAVQSAFDFMKEFNAGQHKLRVLGVEQWREYVQFYCMSDSELPNGLTGDTVIDAVDNEEFDSDIEDLPDEPEQYADHMITVDVYPRHESEVIDLEEEESD